MAANKAQLGLMGGIVVFAIVLTIKPWEWGATEDPAATETAVETEVTETEEPTEEAAPTETEKELEEDPEASPTPSGPATNLYNIEPDDFIVK